MSELPPADPPVEASRPDVVLVIIETLRADHVGDWGYARDTMPNLGALAAQGTRYEHAIAPAPWTLPSVTSLLTGVAPAVHGIHHADKRLPASVETVAERMAAVGYDTAFFGVNPFFEQDMGLQQGFATWSPFQGHTGDALNRELRPWLQARTERPFFLVLHYYDPHCRYRPPARFQGRFDDAPSETLAVLSPEAYDSMGACFQLQQDDGSPELSLDTYFDAYDAEIAAADHALGDALGALGDIGRRDGAWVGVTGDHGEEFWEHGDHGHGRQLFEESVHVPLVVRPPGGAAPVVVDETVSTMSLTASLLSAAGIEASLPHVLPLDDPGAHALVVSETHHEGQDLVAGWHDRDKAILDLSNGLATFHDLRRDPKERIAGRPNPKLLSELTAWHRAIEPWPTESTEGPSTEELRELGYVKD